MLVVSHSTEAGETPLQLAIHCRLGLVVEALCVRGVDMSRLDANGVPPLWAALDSAQEEVASVCMTVQARLPTAGHEPPSSLDNQIIENNVQLISSTRSHLTAH